VGSSGISGCHRDGSRRVISPGTARLLRSSPRCAHLRGTAGRSAHARSALEFEAKASGSPGWSGRGGRWS
jgi:hypothetical protein